MGPEPVDIGEWGNPDKIVDRLLAEAKAHPGSIISGACEAWTLCFSSGGEEAWGISGGHKLGNVFSARVRRSTKERDWRVLGQMAARIGAPKEATPETIRTDANTTHYFVWGGTIPKEERERLTAAAVALFRQAMYGKNPSA